MKKLIVICIVAVAFASNVFAENEEKDINVKVTTDFYSKYVWRGILLNDDAVWQSSVNVSWKNLTATLWGNVDLSDYNGREGDLYEMDYALDYSNNFPYVKCLGYSVGVARYTFPGSDIKETTELYAGLKLSCPLSPSLKIYRDVDEAHGTYVAFSIGHSIEKIAKLCQDVPVALELGASLGWGNNSYDSYYWGASHSKLNDLTLSVSFPFEIAGWGIKPSFNYVTLVSDSIRESEAYGADSDFFFTGIGLCKKF